MRLCTKYGYESVAFSRDMKAARNSDWVRYPRGRTGHAKHQNNGWLRGQMGRARVGP